jgi:PAS domain S-box-containing protein
MGSFATILAVIPVIASSWLLGVWGGALAGLVAFLLDMFLLYVVRSPDLQVMLGIPAVPISMVLLTIGVVVGRLRDVSDQLERQLADRKRVEEALRETEAKYRTLVEQVPAAIYMDALDEISSPIYFSPQVEAMLGYSPEKWRADPELWVKLLHPDDRQRILAENTRTNATGEPFKVEYRLIARDGRIVWVRDDAVLVRDEAGRPRFWRGVLFDITDRKRAEEVLRRQNEYLSTLHETALGLMNRLELKDVLENIITRAAQLLGAPHGYIYLAEPGATEIKWKVGAGIFSVPPLDRIEPGDGLTGQVWRTGQPLIVEDYDTWPGRLPNAPLGEIRAVMAMPLKSGEQVVGVIVMAHVESGLKFGNDDVELLSRFAQLALIALDNARLYQAEREQRELAETLREIGATLVSTLDVDTVLDRILEQVSGVVPNDAANVMLVKDDQTVIARWRGYERFGEAPAQVVFSIATTPYLKQMVETGEPVTIPDTRTDPNWIPASQTEWIRSFASAPIRARGKVIGFLNVDAATPGFFEPVHVERLGVFADQAAIALENARLFTETQKSAQRMQALYETSRALSSSLEEEPLMRAMLEAADRMLGYEYATISTVDEAARRVGMRHGIWGGQFDLFPEWIQMAQYALDQPDILTDICRTGRTEIIGEWDDRFNREIWDRFGHERLLRVFMPIKIRDRVIGVIEAGYDRQTKGRIGDDEVLLLAAFADQVAAALENARLYRVEREQLRRLQESQAQLLQAEKMAALGRLIGSISHEINNPLQAIQGSLTLIEDEVEGGLRPEKLKRYAGIAEQSSERIANVVRRVREFYRPASQALRPTDVRAVLEAVLALADNQLKRGNVAVEQEQVGDVPLVQANADELQQVLLNLVLNAVGAMEAHGGTLCVRMERDRMRTRDGPARPAVRLEVSDTGDGIPPEILPHIFEPFTTTHPDKTALGLSISYAIIEAHGGQMTVASQMGVGTTFTLLLPVEMANGE